jgi:hypothetical protein
MSEVVNNGVMATIGPKDDEFEQTAFANCTGAGAHFDTLQGIEARVEGPVPVEPITSVSNSDPPLTCQPY